MALRRDAPASAPAPAPADAPADGASPHRDATIYGVARHAGVSTATVSRVLSGSPKVADATREAVLDAVRDLRYVPQAAARALAGRRTHALGLVLPHIDGPYYADLLVGFEVAASALGRSVVISLATPGTDVRRLVASLAGQVDGVAFMARSAVTEDQIADLGRSRPVITVARPAVPGHPSFFTENREVARELTEHLLATGRRRLVHVGRPDRGSDLEARHRGVREALAARGLPAPARIDVAPLETEGEGAARRILAEHPDVDAVVCGNDQLAVSVMAHLLDEGVDVGGRVAVTGWDDTMAAAYVRPGLTTVRQPVRELGARAARCLVGLVDGTDTGAAGTGEHRRTAAGTAPVSLPSHIVHRGSCCR